MKWFKQDVLVKLKFRPWPYVILSIKSSNIEFQLIIIDVEIVKIRILTLKCSVNVSSLSKRGLVWPAEEAYIFRLNKKNIVIQRLKKNCVTKIK